MIFKDKNKLLHLGTWEIILHSLSTIDVEI